MAGNPSFVAYIDEAGDEGFKFGQGSSEWFVMGGIVLPKQKEIGYLRLVDDVRRRLNQGRKPEYRFPDRKAIHFRDLDHNVRKYFANRIAQADIPTFASMMLKSDTPKESVAKVHRALYHVLLYDLLERMAWYCTRNYQLGSSGDGSLDIVLSSRSTMNYEKLRTTSGDILHATTDPSFNVPPNVLRLTEIRAVMHSRSLGLQIADAVASSFFMALENSADGLTEDGYVRLLMPCVYHLDEEVHGYGVRGTHWKEQTQEKLKNDIFRWRI